MKYRFNVQVCQDIIVEGTDAEDARMKIVDKEVDTILNTACDDLGLDAYVSDGVEVK